MKKKPISKSPKKIREDLIEKLKNYNNILGDLPTIKASIIELHNSINPEEINKLNKSNKSLFSFVIDAWNKEKADKISQVGPRILDIAFTPVEEICKLLIEYMDPSALNITNKTGDLPLHWAIKNGYTELCKLLINKLSSQDLELEWRNKDFYGEKETALQLIYDEYNKFHNRIDLNNIKFVDTKHLQTVGELLISKISPAAREKIISFSAHEKIVKGPYYPQNELIEIIKKYESKQYKQLTDVIQDNNSNIQQVQELLDQMRPEQLMITSQNNDSNTVLMDAIDAIRAYNNPNRNTICELLINKNPEIVNKHNKFQYTALFKAVNQGDIELCRLIMPHLLYNMLNISTLSGETPLKAAINSGKPEIVQYLIEQGCLIQDVLSIINDGPPTTTSKFHVSYNELIYQAIRSNSNLQDLLKYAEEADDIYLRPQQLNPQEVAYEGIICNRLKAHIKNHGLPTHLQTLYMVINNEELINERILDNNIPEGPTTEGHIVIEANNNSSTQTVLKNAPGLDLQNEPLYSLEELKKINQLFPEISKTPDKWQEASKKYSGLDIKKFNDTFKQVNDISSDQLSNIKDLSADIAIKIGLYLHYKEKQYDKALKYFQEALKLKESSPLDSVKILTYIGDLSETKGGYKESLNYYNTAIKKIPDSNASYDNRLDIVFLHERLAATYENLYQMNSDEDKSVVLLTNAIKHIEISLEMCKELEQKSSLQEHEKSSSQVQEKKLTVYDKIYNTAAMIYETKGDPQKALDYYEKTLEIRKELYGKEHFSIAEIYNNIGLFYHNQALILREVFDTKNNSDIDSSIDKIRFLCNKLKTGPKAVDIPKRFEEEAKTELKNAAQILEKWGGDIYGNVQYNLGLIHKSLGEIQEAQQSFEKAVATLRELYPNGHTSIVKALNSLALIYKQDNKEQAFNCYTEALEIAKKIYGDDNNYIIATLKDNIEVLRKSMPSKVKSSRNTWHKDEEEETPKQALEFKKQKAALENAPGLQSNEELPSKIVEDNKRDKDNIAKIEKKLETMEFEKIPYYKDNKSIILECEKLAEIESEHLDKFCEELKKRLEHIKESATVNAYVTKGDVKPHIDDSNRLDINNFVAHYQKKYLERKNIYILKDDIYSVLTDYAITFEDTKLLNAIFEKLHYTNIFTTVNKLGNSPVYNLLISNNQDLQKSAIEYLGTSALPKTNVHPCDQQIFNTLNCPLISDLDSDVCEEKLLKPLFLDESFNSGNYS